MSEDRTMQKMKHYKAVVWQTNEYTEGHNICMDTTLCMKPNWWIQIIDFVLRRKPKEQLWIAFTTTTTNLPANYDHEVKWSR